MPKKDLIKVISNTDDIVVMKMVRESLLYSDLIEIPLGSFKDISLSRLESLKQSLKDDGYQAEVLAKPDVTRGGDLFYNHYLIIGERKNA